jgi:hypothetical protein
MKSIKFIDFAELFSTNVDEIHTFCNDIIEKADFSYSTISDYRKDNIILEIIKKIDSFNLPIAGKERQNDWNDGWQENFESFIKNNYDLNQLIPRYYKKYSEFKLKNEFIKVNSADFEYNYLDVFRTWIFKKYLVEADSLYEFGCGTAHNLVKLASLFPEKKLYGYDWANPTLKIIDVLQNKFKLNIEGGLFDFFNPSEELKLSKNAAIITFGALEQTGKFFIKFIEFILKEKPKIIINIECINELYDEKLLFDYLSLKYHIKRNYLFGYLSYLRKLESNNEIEIINTHHHKFGNIYTDTHSFVIWKPKY